MNFLTIRGRRGPLSITSLKSTSFTTGEQQRYKIDLTPKFNFNKQTLKTSDMIKDTLGLYDDYKPIQNLTEEQKKDIFEKETSKEGPGGIPSWKTDPSYSGKTPQEVLKNMDVRTWIPNEILWERMKLDIADEEDHYDFSDTPPDRPPQIADSSDRDDLGVLTQNLPREKVIKRINNIAQATGARKSCVASVFISPGKGTFMVNGRKLIDYFPESGCRSKALYPLVVTETLGTFDVRVDVHGGGFTGQSEAIRHGLSKALESWDPDHSAVLRYLGMSKRDIRVVERKKPGQKKARKKFQWSKR